MKKLLILVLIITTIFTMISCTQNSSTDNTGSKETVFEKFEKSLSDKGYTFEKVKMASELVGAKEGVKYKTDKGNIELYEFDRTTESYKQAVTEQKLVSQYGSFSATVENGYALLCENAEIIELFIEIVK